MIFFRWWRRSDHVSTQWLQQQERREMRIEFHGVAWNWKALITEMKRREWRERAQRRKVA